jgi:hypothetical protein
VTVARYAADPVRLRQWERIRGWRSGFQLGLAGIVVLPLAIAGVVLLWRPWAPTLDMAMTELRVRDVGGRHTPLIGLPGRIGDFPDQGSHPGPLSFYLIAPFYRLAGVAPWGMAFGSVVLNIGAVAAMIALGARLAGRRGAVLIAAVAALAIRGYGLSVLTHPWNPYLPLLLWLLVVVAAWAVLAGDHWAAVVVVAAGSVAAQTHVPYLLNAIAISALVGAVLIWRGVRLPPGERRSVTRPAAWSLGVAAVLWLPPLVDQVVRDPGNIRMLIDHFTADPDQPYVDRGTAVWAFFRHLDAFAAGRDMITQQAAFVHRSGLVGSEAWGGVVIFVLWLGAVWISVRRRDRMLLALNAVVAVALVVSAFSISRIFGKLWYYLTLWAWAAMLLAVVAIVWAALVEVSARREKPVDRRAVWATAAVGAVATIASVAAVAALEVPEPHLSDGLRGVVPETVAAIERGDGLLTGPDGRYLVFWQDAVFIGAQGYGLVNELDRRGYDVGVRELWRVPVTAQRVFPDGTYDAELHLVTGKFIDDWRARSDHREIVTFDPRTPDEQIRFADLRDRVGRRLSEIGRPELITVVDCNLFGASLDPDLPPDVVDDLSEMLVLGDAVSVFVAPPGSPPGSC